MGVKSEHSVISIVYDRDGNAVNAANVAWAVSILTQELAKKGVGVAVAEKMDECGRDNFTILLLGMDSKLGERVMSSAGLQISRTAESFGLFKADVDGKKDVLAAVGFDGSGIMYALLELADRVKYAGDPMNVLRSVKPICEKPANLIRSIKRVFSSEIEDKPWFYDRKFWEEYLTELAMSRLNRINLTLGMAIDNGHDPDLRDNYFCYPYPFFVSLDEYPEVRAKYLPKAEQAKNLEMLRFISSESKRRGIHFQLAIWTSAYQMVDCPYENYPILGMSEANHAAYTRDGLCALLKACPDIDGVTLRLHYESGIPEPAHEFWRVVFEGVKECGRIVELDLHAKGADFEFIKLAVDTGMPVVVCGKYHAEHFALPYHQANIRPTEMPEAAKDVPEDWAVTFGIRRFTRYGYADFLREDRDYGFIFRIFPGTIRLLLWGDPALAAGYGRNGSFCGALGIEHMEPLTYKARKDSGFPGRRDPYACEDLQLPGNTEWKKYEYFYRIWGRHLYNPDTDPDVWRRYLTHEFADAAQDCEYALSYASRILPLITFSHLPSAAHNGFWAEMYTNMPITRESDVYGDTMIPKKFSTVSPLDSEMFYRIIDFADAVIAGSRTGKLSPYEVADRLDKLANQAEKHLKASEVKIFNTQKPEYRRWYIDTAVQIWIGRFFAAKFRAGLEYELYEKTRNKSLLEQAIKNYRQAQAAWKGIIEVTRGVYREDITFGFKPHMRGSWADRLGAIQEDIASMEEKLSLKNDGAPLCAKSAAVLKSVSALMDGTQSFEHIPPCSFVKGAPIAVAMKMPAAKGKLVKLHYRHVNQSEKFNSLEMIADGDSFEAVIPEEFTNTSWPVMYFFEVIEKTGTASFLPCINETMDNVPYYVIRDGVMPV